MLMDRSDMQPLQMLLRTMMSNIQIFADDVGTVVGGAGDACIGSWRWCKDGDGGRDNRTDYPSVSIHPEVLYEKVLWLVQLRG